MLGLSDAAGNVLTDFSEPATNETYTLDYIAPSVTISMPSNDPTNGPFSVTALFTEPVTSLEAGVFSVTNGTLSDRRQGSVRPTDIANGLHPRHG